MFGFFFFFKKDNPKAATFSIHFELLRSYLFNFITFTKLHLVTKGQRQRIRDLCFPSVLCPSVRVWNRRWGNLWEKEGSRKYSLGGVVFIISYDLK